MKRTILIIASILWTGLFTAVAQQTGKVTRTFFPDPDIEITTPAFTKKHGFTTYNEMMNFLHQLTTSHPDLLKLEIVGRTQRGRDIPMIRISNGGYDKLRILYLGSVHGNEPAGTEGLLYFIQQMTQNKELKNLLNKVDFYILPMVNIDGSEVNKRATANNTDLNRDQTMLSTPEARTMQRVANTVNPHVFIDFHEYKPLRTSYEELTGKLITSPNDFMFLWSSHPNVAPSLRDVLLQLYIPEASQMADKEGLNHQTYFTTKSNQGDIIFNIGGVSPRSSCNIMALRGAISMLMEIRGIGIGRTSYKRRVYTVYKLAEQYGKTTSEHSERIRKATEEALQNKNDLGIIFQSKAVSDYPLEFIDMLACKKIIIPVEARIAAEGEILLARKRPVAYYLPASEKRAAETLLLYGIKVEKLDIPCNITAECYHIKSTKESYESVANVFPLGVTCQTEQHSITLPAGSYRIPMDQSLASLIGTLLEPESVNGFVNYRIIDATVGKELPIYREIN